MCPNNNSFFLVAIYTNLLVAFICFYLCAYICLNISKIISQIWKVASRKTYYVYYGFFIFFSIMSIEYMKLQEIFFLRRRRDWSPRPGTIRVHTIWATASSNAPLKILTPFPVWRQWASYLTIFYDMYSQDVILYRIYYWL